MSDKPTPETTPALAPTEVFRAGTYTDARGQQVTITVADLAATVAAYDPAHSPAPHVIGHPQLDDPAQGWVGKLELRGDVLVASEHRDVAPAFADQVAAGRYRKRSMAFHGPASTANPKPGIWYPKHVGWLGAAAPAVPGLRDVALADGEEILTVEFAELPGAPWWVLGTLSDMLRRLREDAIANRGSEVADRLMPTWMIDVIAEAARYREPDVVPAVLETRFAGPPEGALPEITPELRAVQAREAAVAAREAALADREDVAFADSLIASGELLPAKRDATLQLLKSLRSTAEFAAGDGADPRQLVRQLAGGGLPALGAVSDPEPGVLEDVSFAAPPGYAVDPASMQLYAAAEQLRRTNPHLSLIDAAKQLER
jgi:hypothetical protein